MKFLLKLLHDNYNPIVDTGFQPVICTQINRLAG